MGRVLLAGLDEARLEQYLAATSLHQFTATTVGDTEALRAALKRVRDQGWAIVDSELEEGLRSVAVPIHDRSGRVVAAANVSAHASRTSLDQLRGELLPRLQATVARIEADLHVAPDGG